ncbi:MULTISPECIES: DUF7144 family membrane protein [Streptomyces]|uniref:DUF7144 domain-containing protein n=1 Tax=Streptomyces dengpaensis TaxID=2049881 RepID=A0ABN5IAX9_9ACTN|nr:MULTISPECIES: hypothetical protein [Streptomyces]AVH60233.1 hypothetical protein C4B68_35580 [Streptomyces dengpaensis]PIB04287.1 hypothetical protein B1C81_33325 [Streptomyces sp. HG99]
MTGSHTTHVHATKQQWAVGLMAFAAVMLMITGVLAILRGISAIAQDEVWVTTENYLFQFDLTGWGWLHLSLGVVAVIVSLGLFQSAMWARVLGVTIAGLVIIANFLSLPSYPVWSVVMIALSGFVIWALCVARTEESSESYEPAPRSG